MLIVTKLLVAGGVAALAIGGPSVPRDGTFDGQAVASVPDMSAPGTANAVAPYCVAGCNLWQMMVLRGP